MGTYFAVKIVLILIFAVVGLIAKVARGSKTNPQQQNFQSKPPNQAPFPTANNQFQPSSPQIPNPFQQINDANNGPGTSETDINSLFNNPPTNFSNPPVQNTYSDVQSFYCMYCGKKFGNVDALLKDACFKHPQSANGLQKHVLYRGAGKPNVGF